MSLTDTGISPNFLPSGCANKRIVRSFHFALAISPEHMSRKVSPRFTVLGEIAQSCATDATGEKRRSNTVQENLRSLIANLCAREFIALIFKREKYSCKQNRTKKGNGPDCTGPFPLAERRGRERGRLLKINLETQLHDARIACGTDRVEQRRGSVQRSTANRVGVVESVERLPAQLAGETLCEFDVLE
jgi:hypothetical protein